MLPSRIIIWRFERYKTGLTTDPSHPFCWSPNQETLVSTAAFCLSRDFVGESPSSSQSHYFTPSNAHAHLSIDTMEMVWVQWYNVWIWGQFFGGFQWWEFWVDIFLKKWFLTWNIMNVFLNSFISSWFFFSFLLKLEWMSFEVTQNIWKIVYYTSMITI